MAKTLDKENFDHIVPEHQADATKDQANPVQNTWYTVLDTTDYVRLIGVCLYVADTAETLAVQITVDGQTVAGSGAATADTWYEIYLDRDGTLVISNNALFQYRAYILEGRSIKVEVRKTTATGAGNLKARVYYAAWT